MNNGVFLKKENPLWVTSESKEGGFAKIKATLGDPERGQFTERISSSIRQLWRWQGVNIQNSQRREMLPLMSP